MSTGPQPTPGRSFDRDLSWALLEFGLGADAVDWTAGATVSIDDLSDAAAAVGSADWCIRPCTCGMGVPFAAQVAA
ncbi:MULTISPECIES: hypothetical protein [unclassified Streptomyces]|uniref:hypothetical protein n=1 Tax=unclassified Streptomyces TaxID=2593676 RepID=UPI001EF97C13|nr:MULTISPECIES: hypothetical protein [unclassified Streptomyces]